MCSSVSYVFQKKLSVFTNSAKQLPHFFITL